MGSLMAITFLLGMRPLAKAMRHALVWALASCEWCGQGGDSIIRPKNPQFQSCSLRQLACRVCGLIWKIKSMRLDCQFKSMRLDSNYPFLGLECRVTCLCMTWKGTLSFTPDRSAHLGGEGGLDGGGLGGLLGENLEHSVSSHPVSRNVTQNAIHGPSYYHMCKRPHADAAGDQQVCTR